MSRPDYVEHRDDGYWVAGTRVSLDSIVYAFLNGDSAESIAQSFPLLRLEQVYGAIAFYLGHRAKIDAYLEEAHLSARQERAFRNIVTCRTAAKGGHL